MHVALISIGNSKAILLSKSILEEYSITDSVEIILEKDCIILKPKSLPRSGWDRTFKNMHDHGEDSLLLPDVFKDENPEEWS